MDIEQKNIDNHGSRFDYIDLCKVLAMFLVTWAHCAQQISGRSFPNMLLTKDVFISINMPIFMIASGFVVNLDKMKRGTVRDYLISKFCRLILPMTTWYLILSVTIFPRHIGYWDAYWYLSALFVCLVIIKLLLCIFSTPQKIMIVSTLILTIIPLSIFERSCFMIPFIWGGFWLRKYIDKIDWKVVGVLLLIYGLLYFFWKVDYSVYISPFNILNVNAHSLFCLFYRFSIGFVGGVAFIVFLRLLMCEPCGKYLKCLSKYGNYTLVFYTMSFVLNAVIARVLWHYDDFYINMKGLLDIVSFVITGLMMMVMYYFQKIVGNSKMLSKFILGNALITPTNNNKK